MNTIKLTTLTAAFSLFLLPTAPLAQTMDELPGVLMEQLNCQTTSDDPQLRAFANDLADEDLTAARDAEIAAALPTPYTMQVNARAQIDGETIRVPRRVMVDANRQDGEWTLGLQGRRQRLAKDGCVVGSAISLDLPSVTIARFIVLWKRVR